MHSSSAGIIYCELGLHFEVSVIYHKSSVHSTGTPILGNSPNFCIFWISIMVSQLSECQLPECQLNVCPGAGMQGTKCFIGHPGNWGLFMDVIRFVGMRVSNHMYSLPRQATMLSCVTAKLLHEFRSCAG